MGQGRAQHLTEPKGKQARLDRIQARYRAAMLAVYDLPQAEQGARIREILATLAREKAAVGDVETGEADE